MPTPREQYIADPTGADDVTAEFYLPASKVTVPGGVVSDVGMTADQVRALVQQPGFIDRNTAPSSATSLVKSEVYRAVVPAGFGADSVFQMYTMTGDSVGIASDVLSAFIDIEPLGGGTQYSVMNIETPGDQTLSRLSFMNIGVAGFGYSTLPPDAALTLGVVDGQFATNGVPFSMGDGFELVFSLAGRNLAGDTAVRNTMVFSFITGYNG